jgi:hypothetical protein
VRSVEPSHPRSSCTPARVLAAAGASAMPSTCALKLTCRALACVSIRHTSAYVSIRQHTSGASAMPSTCALKLTCSALACVSIRQHAAYVSIRQHTSAYVRRQHWSPPFCCQRQTICMRHTSAYVSIRQAPALTILLPTPDDLPAAAARVCSCSARFSAV